MRLSTASLATREFVDELEQRNSPRHGDDQQRPEQFNLRGFRIVDEAKFNALPDEVILEYRQKNWLSAIISHLVSIQNLAALGFRSKSADA